MIPLGPGPVPTDSTELSTRLDAAIRRILSAAKATDASSLDVSATLAEPGAIDLVATNLTGVEVSGGRYLRPTAADAASREPVTLSVARVMGLPLLARGAAVTVSAEATNVPLAWVHASDGELWLVPVDPASTADGGEASAAVASSAVAPSALASSAAAPSAVADLSIEIDDVERLVRDEIDKRVRAQGFTLKSSGLDLQPGGRRGIVMKADVTVGRSFLSAKVSVSGRITIDDAMILTISDLEFYSGNPIVSVAMGAMNSRIRPWNGRRIDLARYTFAGARLTDVDITVDTAVRVRARFGPPVA